MLLVPQHLQQRAEASHTARVARVDGLLEPRPHRRLHGRRRLGHAPRVRARNTHVARHLAVPLDVRGGGLKVTALATGPIPSRGRQAGAKRVWRGAVRRSEPPPPASRPSRRSSRPARPPLAAAPRPRAIEPRPAPARARSPADGVSVWEAGGGRRGGASPAAPVAQRARTRCATAAASPTLSESALASRESVGSRPSAEWTPWSLRSVAAGRAAPVGRFCPPDAPTAHDSRTVLRHEAVASSSRAREAPRAVSNAGASWKPFRAVRPRPPAAEQRSRQHIPGQQGWPGCARR